MAKQLAKYEIHGLRHHHTSRRPRLHTSSDVVIRGNSTVGEAVPDIVWTTLDNRRYINRNNGPSLRKTTPTPEFEGF